MSTTVVEVGQTGGDVAAALRVGHRLELRLSETPTTGYRWRADADSLLLQREDRFDGPAAPMGAGGTRIMVFEAAAPGSTRLSLQLRRAWGDQTPAATVNVSVTVAA